MIYIVLKIKLREVQKQNLKIEYQPLLDKMLDVERRRDKLEYEQEKDILTSQLERYYRKVYRMKADYDI
jgi:hypothetical protein